MKLRSWGGSAWLLYPNPQAATGYSWFFDEKSAGVDVIDQGLGREAYVSRETYALPPLD
jgi:hypothetical protein